MLMKAGKEKVINLSLNNIRIEQVFGIQFLRRILNSNMSNTDHDRNESGNRLMQMATTIKAGLRPKVAVNIDKSFIRSKQEHSISSFSNLNETSNKLMSRA